MKRAVLAFFLPAVVAGVVGGLLYTWVLDPIETYETTPDALRFQDKIAYLGIVSDLYALEGDLRRTEVWLAELGIEADGPVVAGLIERYLDSGGRPEEVRSLAHLAKDLGASGGVLLVFASPPDPLPELTPTSPPQPGASPTPAPSATPAPSFRLVEQTSVCGMPDQPRLIAVRVLDAEGTELSGIEIVVSWATGQDRFFTGLQPEQGAGYADFEMAPEVEYDVSLADYGGEAVRGLTADLLPDVCPTDAVGIDWRVTFQRVP
jgi:hypothetical protein